MNLKSYYVGGIMTEKNTVLVKEYFLEINMNDHAKA
jgi:hypothetical protein|tara:strand:+ start:26 stop:133 length:108 start_codon:yes stop_codon:yes gene_type:complete